MNNKNRDMRSRWKPAPALAALLFFIAAAAIPLAAQEAAPPKLSMWNRGLFNLYTSDGTTSGGPNWMGYATDQGPYNSLSLNWAGKLVNWSMTAEWDGDGSVYPIYLHDYSASYAMFTGFVRFTAGKVYGGDDYRFRNFDTTGFSTRIANAETGVMVQVLPAKNLSLGAFIPIPVAERSAEITYSRPNFGFQWVAGDFAILKSSLRLEPLANGNREASVGVSLTAIRNFGLTLGYTYRDVTMENDFFLDTSWRSGPLTLHAFADLNLVDADLYYGGKVNAEYAFPTIPFTLGGSASYGNGDIWYNDSLELYPYLRYNFSGSSVQTGVVVDYADAWTYKVQLQYTVGF